MRLNNLLSTNLIYSDTSYRRVGLIPSVRLWDWLRSTVYSTE